MMTRSRSAALAAVLAIAVAGAGCGGRPDAGSPTRPEVAAPSLGAEIDPEVAKLFDDPPIAGRVPSEIAWSPEGSRIAYVRRSVRPSGEACREIWIHEVATHREAPVLADPDLSVSEIAWAGEDAIVAVAGGDLHLVGADGSVRRLTDTAADEGGVAVPEDGTRAAFVRDHDVWTMDLATGEERPVTEGGTEERSFGEVTWVYGEELDTEAGLGWSPDGALLWLYGTDATAAPERAVVADSSGGVRYQTYPRPGEPNPVVRIGVTAAGGGGITWLDTGNDPDVYLPQVTWHPDGRRLAVVRIDRLQTLIELLLCDARTGACEAVIEERDPRWVNLLGRPVFLGDGGGFLWLSERSGFAHVHRFDLDGTHRAQITGGEWVVGGILHADAAAGRAYVTANPETPVSRGVYRISLDGGEVARISPEGGVHAPVFSPDGALYVDVRSALGRPPRADLFDASGREIAPVAAADRSGYETPKEVSTEVFSLETEDGAVLWASLTRPRVLDPARRYPVLVYVYGGPGAQVVLDAFNASTTPWRDLLARRGIMVFSLDGRGSAGRGREFEAAIHLGLGEVELEDQLAGVRYLCAQPYVDPSRIGVFGWSYGGTMALACLLRGGGAFRAGAAVAPVTDWREYDTAYTERYMQRPSDNPEGYDDTSLVDLAGELRSPLLLAHGLADDNVHFACSARLVEALVKAGRDFDLLVYPGGAHGLRGPSMRAHLFSRITRFFEEHLLGSDQSP